MRAAAVPGVEATVVGEEEGVGSAEEGTAEVAQAVVAPEGVETVAVVARVSSPQAELAAEAEMVVAADVVEAMGMSEVAEGAVMVQVAGLVAGTLAA